MKKPSKTILAALDHWQVHRYSQRIAQIFLDSFTTGAYSHNQNKLGIDFAIESVHRILGHDNGLGYAAFDDGQYAHPEYPIGFVLGMAAHYDELIGQTTLAQKYDLKECLYIAELAIDQAHRSRKIGQLLVKKVIAQASEDKKLILVRTNEHSPQLHQFYEGLGFKKLEATAMQRSTTLKRYFALQPNLKSFIEG